MVGEKVERALGVREKLGPFFARSRAPTIVVDREGRFVTANDAALAQYGYELDELLRMRIDDFMAEPRPELPADLEHAYRGEPRTLDRRPHRRKDGSVLWVVPVAGPQTIDGQTYIVSVLQDVTALVSAEERERFEHERVEVLWQGAAEHLDGSFALLDGQRRLLRINHTMAGWLGRSEQEVVGLRCDQVFLGRCTRQPCPHMLALADGRRVVEEIVSSRGRPLRIEVFPAPANHTGVALVHVGHDLSSERELRSRLVAADRLASLGRVAAGVAHEVNNPAAFLTLALPLAKERLEGGRTREAVTLLDEAIDAMAQISEVMHDLGGVARDRPRALVDLATLASGAIRIGGHEAEGRAKLERDFEDGVTVVARGARVAQVLLNLIVNAAQAIPKGDSEHQRIVVRVRHAGDRALVEVADTGPGVPDQTGDRIFEPFFTTRSALGGTGLGLWLSRAIVEEEGGTLSWRNRPEGGAQFTVSLPLAHTPAAHVDASAE
jgi:PAS domain S-box-containing protein